MCIEIRSDKYDLFAGYEIFYPVSFSKNLLHGLFWRRVNFKLKDEDVGRRLD